MVTRIQEIVKILALYQASRIPNNHYVEGKPSYFFVENDKVMIAQLFDVTEGKVNVHKSREAVEEDVTNENLLAYQREAKDILMTSYFEQIKEQLYSNYVQPPQQPN